MTVSRLHDVLQVNAQRTCFNPRSQCVSTDERSLCHRVTMMFNGSLVHDADLNDIRDQQGSFRSAESCNILSL